jgi:hypothetical protein
MHLTGYNVFPQQIRVSHGSFARIFASTTGDRRMDPVLKSEILPIDNQLRIMKRLGYTKIYHICNSKLPHDISVALAIFFQSNVSRTQNDEHSAEYGRYCCLAPCLALCVFVRRPRWSREIKYRPG